MSTRQIFTDGGQYENWVNKYLNSSFNLAHKVIDDSKKGWFSSSGNDNQSPPRDNFGATHIHHHHHNYAPYFVPSSPTVINNYGNSQGPRENDGSKKNEKPQENNDVAGVIAFTVLMGLMYAVGKVYSDWEKISAVAKKDTKFSKEFSKATKTIRDADQNPGVETVKKVMKNNKYLVNRLERDSYITLSLLVAGAAACLFISVGALMHVGSAVLVGKLLVIPTAGLACFKYGYETNEDVIKKANKIINLLTPQNDQ